MSCDCHGEPMYWHKDRRSPVGGYWRCAVLRREAHRRHARTEKRLASQGRHTSSEKGRATKRAANSRSNPTRIIVGNDYFGTLRFTESEVSQWHV